MKFYTIGVYNNTETQFFSKLLDNRIDVFCDIRQRRGVRGAKYSFVNSNKLQAKLGELGINYGHIIELAPTSDIREVQKNVDKAIGQAKNERIGLAEEFISQYTKTIIANFDFNIFFENLEKIGAKNVVLFCVEEHPDACHRSIVSKTLSERYNYEIKHL